MTLKSKTDHEVHVYLLPVGSSQYELYFEPTDDEDLSNVKSSELGAMRVFYSRFKEMLAEAQAVRQSNDDSVVSVETIAKRPLLVRARNWLLSWIAEAIMEERLLWQLRTRHQALLIYPDDIDFEQAIKFSQTSFQRDVDRHRFWLIIDVIMALILGPLLFFIPGPNLIAYYFVFRSVGHFLSWRGARNGLRDITWHACQSASLVQLREILTLEFSERTQHVRAIEAQLGLKHLVAFIQHMGARFPVQSRTS